jgi:hypothetical protein
MVPRAALDRLLHRVERLASRFSPADEHSPESKAMNPADRDRAS